MKKILNKSFVILLIINFFLFLPGLFEPVSYGDECIYLTLGNAFRKGLIFYKDIHDNKPPFLYLLAAFANSNLFWFRFITIITNLLHLFLIFKIIKLLTKNNWIPLAGSIIFTIGSLIFEGKIGNGEVFMMLPATFAVYLILKNFEKKTLFFGLSIGLLFSIGFMFKIPVFFDLVGIIFALYIIPIVSLKKKEIIKILKDKRFWGIILGFSIPIFLSTVYYGFHGAFVPYVRSALLQNIGYLSSWGGSDSKLIIRAIALLALTIIIFLIRKKLNYHAAFFLSWFIFALFASLLSKRPYPHYLLEILPSLTLLVALAFNNLKNKSTVIAATGALLGTIFSFFYFRFWWYPIWPYYQNFLSFIIGAKNQQQYLSYWGERTISDHEIAVFVKNHTQTNDRIFVWGEGVCIYTISQRLPPGRYTTNYHIYDFNGFTETLEAIRKNVPSIIIKLNDEKRVWPELDQLLGENYFPLVYKDIRDEIFILRKPPPENDKIRK